MRLLMEGRKIDTFLYTYFSHGLRCMSMRISCNNIIYIILYYKPSSMKLLMEEGKGKLIHSYNGRRESKVDTFFL
jgi:hypothetical protein